MAGFRSGGEGSLVQAQWMGLGRSVGSELKGRGNPLHRSLLAPLKGTAKAEGGAGASGLRPTRRYSSAPGSHRDWVSRQAGLGARPSVSMMAAGDPHGG